MLIFDILLFREGFYFTLSNLKHDIKLFAHPYWFFMLAFTSTFTWSVGLPIACHWPIAIALEASFKKIHSYNLLLFSDILNVFVSLKCCSLLQAP